MKKGSGSSSFIYTSDSVERKKKSKNFPYSLFCTIIHEVSDMAHYVSAHLRVLQTVRIKYGRSTDRDGPYGTDIDGLNSEKFNLFHH
jgi:hypothetical protein